MPIFAYNNGSRSAKCLADELGTKLIRHERSRFKGRPWKRVINWGAKQNDLPHSVMACSVVNRAGSRDKMGFFESAKSGGLVIPEWTTETSVAQEWSDAGHPVVARTILNGHSGAGIIIYEAGQKVGPAPLYTKYVPKKEEYRVHVFGKEVGFVQRKAGKPGLKKNWQVRNLQNGFVFVQEQFAPKVVTDEAVKALEVLDLDFGAVDLVFNEKQKKAYALEVNTAPGLEQRTLDVYVRNLERL